MRVQRIVTNLTCNQACVACTSRAPNDDRAFVAGAAARARIDAALAEGAERLVLTGGEPGLRRDLVELVRHARERGAAGVELETNATTIDGPRAEALAAAGLSLARVNVAAFGGPADAFTRDEGGFAATLAGLHAFAEAGVPIEVATLVVAPLAAALEALPGKIVEALGAGAVRAIVVGVPVESPDPSVLLDYEAATRAVVAMDAAARLVGVPLRASAEAFPPPCAFAQPGRMAHLYALNRGGASRPGHARSAGCVGCAVESSCPGFAASYVARRGAPTPRPISDERTRRRLSLVSTVDEQIARELVTVNEHRDADGTRYDEHIVRVSFHCNQACRFCFVSTHLPPPDDGAVRAAIEAAASAGARVVISGGEPTLNPRLVEWVKLARSLGPAPIELQTNAVLLDDRARVDALVAAGVDRAFVSLHGATAEVSDDVTGAPGTFSRTLVGVDHLVAAGVAVVLNFVVCQRNREEIVAFVRLVAARWPTAWVNLSFVAPSSDVVPRERALVPRYADVLPQIGAALELAERLGLVVVGFESMCGLPLCLVPASLERFVALAGVPEGYDRGEFVHVEACARCSMRESCFGVRRGYVELWGTDDLAPIVTAREHA